MTYHCGRTSDLMHTLQQAKDKADQQINQLTKDLLALSSKVSLNWLNLSLSQAIRLLQQSFPPGYSVSRPRRVDEARATPSKRKL